MSKISTMRSLDEQIEAVKALSESAVAFASSHGSELALIDPEYRASAENLLHYLALRQRDLRPLQVELSHLGLSSLGRLEAHVLATLRAVLFALHRLAKMPEAVGCHLVDEDEFNRGMERLRQHSASILGPERPGRNTRIMVTMPGDAAESTSLIPDLLVAGMDLMRINCAHDAPEIWNGIVNRLRDSQTSSGMHCRVAFDLAGPKLRTGPIKPEPAIFRWKPVRDQLGRTISPAQIRFVPAKNESDHLPDSLNGIPVEPTGFEMLQPGRRIHLSDTRERRLELEIVSREGDSVLTHCHRSGYIAPGTALEIIEGSHHLVELLVAPFLPKEGSITLCVGDRLMLHRGSEPGYSANREQDEMASSNPTISCDFDPLFSDCRPGEPILFDDGLIGGVIREVLPNRLEIEILQTAKNPAKLKAEKGINLPDTKLTVPALTEKDIADLESIYEVADMVSLSFIRGPEDVRTLIKELDRIGAGNVGIILKIETRAAFENLPAILLEALRHPPVAVMIARGDLGVELGFERMAEVQEEILWICEAAHIPVIWATQVLESLAKKGFATRAEVTDAAMSCRAECVMLNKGPFIVEAVETLADILSRMQDHQAKKSSQMRPLSIAGTSAKSS